MPPLHLLTLGLCNYEGSYKLCGWPLHKELMGLYFYKGLLTLCSDVNMFKSLWIATFSKQLQNLQKFESLKCNTVITHMHMVL